MFNHPKKAMLYPKRERKAKQPLDYKGKRIKYRIEQAVLFIDPGITGTGWAFFPEIKCSKKKKPTSICLLFQSGCFTPSKSSGWQKSSSEIWSWFGGLLSIQQPKLVVIESPEAWLSSDKGLASLRHGDILKLMYLIGGMAHVLKQHNMPLPLLVLAREWKGQLPKKVMQQRLQGLIDNLKGLDEHEMDAIGMGIAAQRGL